MKNTEYQTYRLVFKETGDKLFEVVACDIKAAIADVEAAYGQTLTLAN